MTLPESTSNFSGPGRSGQGRWLMFTKFLRRGKVIASVAPSSRFMVRTILRGIDFSKCDCVVELGAGTGPVTAEVLKRAAGTKCRCLFIEFDPDLCRHLRERFPKAEIIEADACDLDQILEERGIKKVNHILCGLPLPSFPEEGRNRILATAARCLIEDGVFRQLTVMPWIYYRLYRRYFADVRFKFVPLNFPPGGVYMCTGWQAPPI